MNAPNFAPLRERVTSGGEYDVDESTAQPVTEGVWFAWRNTDDHYALRDIRHAVWWTHSGSHIVSLATGTGLHGWGGVDFETYMFHPETPESVCCHATFEEAQACALGAMQFGKWCAGTYWDDDDEVAS